MADSISAVPRHHSAGPGAGQSRLATLALLLLPLVLLAGVIVAFLSTGGGLDGQPPAPIHKLDVERKVVVRDGFDLAVRNVGPQELTIAQVIVNDAIWPATVEPKPTLARLDRATVHIPYGWVQGEAYEIKLVTGGSVVLKTTIPVAFETPTPRTETFLSFTLIGLFVGVIPVYLGLIWYPALRQVGRRTMTFLMAATTGLLVYLGVDAGFEAVEQAGAVAGPFQGIGLVGIGIVLTVLLLELLSRRHGREPPGRGRSEAGSRLALATTIALGIGLHNLGEGLAIGAAYAVGEAALGGFLVVGFIIQNITEGLGIVAPILRDRPSLRRLALLGLLGGGPAILGTWVGGFTHSQPLAVLFLAIGAGAVFQVAWAIARMLRADEAGSPAPLVNFAGVAAGMLILYVTGVLIK